jgi:hypothetical protein
VKSQEVDHGSQEILDVLGLGFVSAASVGFLFFGEPFGGPFDLQFGSNAFDGRCWCPHASGKDLSALLLLHHPMISSSFHPPGQSGVTRGHQNPAFWCRED